MLLNVYQGTVNGVLAEGGGGAEKMDKGYINLDIREENLIILTVLSRFEQYHIVVEVSHNDCWYPLARTIFSFWLTPCRPEYSLQGEVKGLGVC